MAIQMRRGEYSKFDAESMLPGEWAVVLESDPNGTGGRSLYMCFSPGVVKRIATFEDMADAIANATEDIVDDLTTAANTATRNANTATTAANTATRNANTATTAANTAASAANTAASNARTAASSANGAAKEATAAASNALQIANSIAASAPPTDKTVAELQDANRVLATALADAQDKYIVLGSTAYMPTSRNSGLTGETITVAKAIASTDIATLN